MIPVLTKIEYYDIFRGKVKESRPDSTCLLAVSGICVASVTRLGR
jgi:hypothetical protein